MVAVLLLIGGPTVVSADPSPSPGQPAPAASGANATSVSPPPGMALVWADEFDDPAGTRPDPARWTYALGDGTADGVQGWGNEELEWYTDEASNAAQDGMGTSSSRHARRQPA